MEMSNTHLENLTTLSLTAKLQISDECINENSAATTAILNQLQQCNIPARNTAVDTSAG